MYSTGCAGQGHRGESLAFPHRSRVYGGTTVHDTGSYGIALFRGDQRTGLRERVRDAGLEAHCREVETDLDRDELFVPGAGVVRSIEEFEELFEDV